MVEFMCVMPLADTLIWATFLSFYSRKYSTGSKKENYLHQQKITYLLVGTKSTQWYWNKVRHAFCISLHEASGPTGNSPRYIVSLPRTECYWSWSRTWWLFKHWDVGGHCSLPQAHSPQVVCVGRWFQLLFPHAMLLLTKCKQGWGKRGAASFRWAPSFAQLPLCTNGSQCRVSIRTRLAPKLGIFNICNTVIWEERIFLWVFEC